MKTYLSCWQCIPFPCNHTWNDYDEMDAHDENKHRNFATEVAAGLHPDFVIINNVICCVGEMPEREEI